MSLDRVIKKASKLVDAALKLSTMTKEIPGNMDAIFNQDGFSILNEDLDPETLEAIEHLLESGILKKAEVTLEDKSDEFNAASDTVGQLVRPLMAGIMLDKAPVTNWSTAKENGITKELDQVIADYNSKHPNLNTKVLLGSLPNNSLENIFSNLNRSDQYLPEDDTVVLYQPNPNVLRHELGHAVDFYDKYNQSVEDMYADRVGYSNILAQEERATGNGRESFSNATPKELQRYARNMGGGYGSYQGSIPGAWLGLGAGFLQTLRNIDKLPSQTTPKTNIPTLMLKKVVLPITLGALTGTALGGIAGGLYQGIKQHYKGDVSDFKTTSNVRGNNKL